MDSQAKEKVGVEAWNGDGGRRESRTEVTEGTEGTEDTEETEVERTRLSKARFYLGVGEGRARTEDAEGTEELNGTDVELIFILLAPPGHDAIHRPLQ